MLSTRAYESPWTGLPDPGSQPATSSRSRSSSVWLHRSLRSPVLAAGGPRSSSASSTGLNLAVLPPAAPLFGRPPADPRALTLFLFSALTLPGSSGSALILTLPLRSRWPCRCTYHVRWRRRARRSDLALAASAGCSSASLLRKGSPVRAVPLMFSLVVLAERRARLTRLVPAPGTSGGVWAAVRGGYRSLLSHLPVAGEPGDRRHLEAVPSLLRGQLSDFAYFSGPPRILVPGHAGRAPGTGADGARGGTDGLSRGSWTGLSWTVALQSCLSSPSLYGGEPAGPGWPYWFICSARCILGSPGAPGRLVLRLQRGTRRRVVPCTVVIGLC